MRTETHITETRSIKKLLNVLPDYWVVRELTERDYGTDLLVEIFDRYGEAGSYFATGSILNLQVKGTTTKIKVNEKDTSISFSLKISFLKYVQKFPSPFILALVELSELEPEGEIYFLWLQRYIYDVLDEQKPDWRESGQDTITVKIPTDNVLPRKLDKLKNIANHLPKLEQLVKYTEIYTTLEPALLALAVNGSGSSVESIKYLRTQIKKIMRLEVLLNNNECCVAYADFQNLLNLLNMCELDNDFSALARFESFYNMGLLADSSVSLSFIENFVAENDGLVVY